tara:strand:- start:1700 stop:2431 length:732 start_codon:yes stop_codon:yes gene_type:complete
MRIVNFTNSQSTSDGANPVLSLDTVDAASDVLNPPIDGEIRTGLVTVQNISASTTNSVEVQGSFGTTFSLAHIKFADSDVNNYDEEVVTIVDASGTNTFTFDKDISAVARSSANTYVVPAITDAATAAAFMKEAIDLARDTHLETGAQCFTSTRTDGSAQAGLEIVGMDSAAGTTFDVSITTTDADMVLEEHYSGEQKFQTIHTFTNIAAGAVVSAVVTLFPEMRINSGTNDDDGYVVATLMV